MKRRDTTPCGKGRQRGISLIGWLLLIILVGGWVYGAIRVIPAYIEDGEIATTLKGVKNDARTLSISDLQRELIDQLNINSIDDVNVNEFKFTEGDGTLTISINHPIKKPLIGNLAVVVYSHHSITVKRGGG